jgi:hypothetical protein
MTTTPEDLINFLLLSNSMLTFIAVTCQVLMATLTQFGPPTSTKSL